MVQFLFCSFVLHPFTHLTLRLFLTLICSGSTLPAFDTLGRPRIPKYYPLRSLLDWRQTDNMLAISRRLVFLFLATAVSSVCGALYPTLPIADTTWRGGRVECVTWIDDGSPIKLNGLGRLDVELYLNGSNHVATLAKNVNPESKFHQFKVVSSWGPNAPNYHVRFVSHHPSATIYTADFAIRDMDYDSLAEFSAAEKKHKQKAVSTDATTATPTTKASVMSLYTPVITLVLPDTTIISTLAPTTPKPTASSHTESLSQLAAAAAVTSAPPSSTPAVVIQSDSDVQDEKEHGGTINSSGLRKTSNASSNRRVDVEKLKFRIVFVLWPVLIGVSMAL
ncbi:hypothetical protein BXZ70DRAFT_925208 [Cristinia sonorae]|uniref:Uncharacterized protein n=1 Tax=Cristinia sonorae TaxID=1940300 RepID=A0A8K0UU12_9AGAR|nr:hypothetical protein BXZ70DRAFT_925208 [Cristinia sonorae]